MMSGILDFVLAWRLHIVCAALSVAIVGELAWIDSVRSLDDAQADRQQDVLAATGLRFAKPLAHPPINQFNEVTRRPLFEPDRQQVATAQATASGAQANEFDGEWRLTGVVLGEQRSVAILEHRKSGETVSLIAGQTNRGWEIEDIDSNELTIRNGQTVREFELYNNENRPLSIAEKNGVLVRKD